MNLDADGRQEYRLARLEGDSHEQAAHRAIRACNRNSVKRQLAPLSPQNLSVKLTHFAFDNENYEPMFVDTRTDAQREADWNHRDTVLPLLDLCTPPQRAVLTLRYGLGTGTPLTLKETAQALGYKHISSAQGHEDRALERIRKVMSKPPVDERLARKRELNRQWMARNRAAKRILDKNAHDPGTSVTLVTSETGCQA